LGSPSSRCPTVWVIPVEKLKGVRTWLRLRALRRESPHPSELGDCDQVRLHRPERGEHAAGRRGARTPQLLKRTKGAQAPRHALDRPHRHKPSIQASTRVVQVEACVRGVVPGALFEAPSATATPGCLPNCAGSVAEPADRLGGEMRRRTASVGRGRFNGLHAGRSQARRCRRGVDGVGAAFEGGTTHRETRAA